MLVTIPLVCWLILWVVCSNRAHSWRLGFLNASLLWGGYSVLTTEFLSAFSALNQAMVACAWLIAMVISLCVLFRDAARDPELATRFAPSRLRAIVKQQSLSDASKWSALAIAGLIVTLGLVAFFCAPSNYDSLTYHLSRVEHWICNASVKHYSTGVLRQLSLNPGAEFIIANLRLLSGGDRFSNCVQWFSMLGSVIGVGLLAKQLGANRRAQLLASVICVSIPIGILECTTAQNDYVAAFWLLCLASHCLILIRSADDLKVTDSVWVGLSLGLAVLTKGTAYFFTFPFMAYLVLVRFVRNKSQACQLMAMSVSIALLLNLPFLLRNIAEFGSPVVGHGNYGPGYRLANEPISLPHTVSNVLRNAAIELESPMAIGNKAVFGVTSAVHQLLGLDVNDPTATFDLIKFRPSGAASQLHEDQAGNVLHFSLFLLAVPLVFFWPKGRLRNGLLKYAACILCGYLIMCACLKWQPWSTRYHLPLLVLASAFTAAALWRISRRLAAPVGALLLLCAVPYVCLNATKPLLGDNNILVTSHRENYFRGVPNYYAPYLMLVQFLSQHHLFDIGVANADNGWCEYPLWVLLSDDFKQPVSIRSRTIDGWSTCENDLPQALVSFERECPASIYVGRTPYVTTFACSSQNDSWTYSLFGHKIQHKFPPFRGTVLLPKVGACLPGVNKRWHL